MIRTEYNVLKALFSSFDALRTWCVLLDFRFKSVSLDGCLFIIGLLVLFYNYLFISAPNLSDLNPWQAAVLCMAGVLIFPYTAYYLISIIYRPVPFFYRKAWKNVPTQWNGKIIAFGKVTYSQEVRDIRDFFNGKTRTLTKQAPFYWSHGKISTEKGCITVKITANGFVSQAHFQGLFRQHLDLSFEEDEVSFGRATLLFQNFPALRMESDNNTLYIVIVDKI